MTDTIDLIPVTSSGLRGAPGEMRVFPHCPDLPEGVGALSCELLLTADGSDRLEVFFSADEVPGGPATALASCVPGRDITLEHPSGILFEGRLHARELKRDRGGTVLSVVAHGGHRGVDKSLAARAYYQHSDSELAETIASDLGLRSRVEATGDIIERIECPGDRVEFLRGRARKLGFEFAITAGTVFFSARLPACGDVPGLPAARGTLSRDDNLLEFSFRDGPDGTRGGSFEVVGDPGWRPLQELDIMGMGEPLDGCYRVARARHRWDHLGYRTRVDYLEDSVDLDSWSSE